MFPITIFSLNCVVLRPAVDDQVTFFLSSTSASYYQEVYVDDLNSSITSHKEFRKYVSVFNLPQNELKCLNAKRFISQFKKMILEIFTRNLRRQYPEVKEKSLS